jgi:hypothetical protein
MTDAPAATIAFNRAQSASVHAFLLFRMDRRSIRKRESGGIHEHGENLSKNKTSLDRQTRSCALSPPLASFLQALFGTGRPASD